MKKIINTTRFLLLLIFPFLLFSQTVEKKIENIRSKYDMILKSVKDSTCNTISIKFSCPDLPAYGYLTYYYEGSELRMMELASDDGSHGGEKQQYFIWNQKIIFCYIEGGDWVFDGGKDTIIGKDTIYQSFTQDYLYEDRYYFYNNKPIKCLHKEFIIHNSQENNPDSETTANKEVDCDTEKIVKRYLNLLKLNAINIKKVECPSEIVNLLSN